MGGLSRGRGGQMRFIVGDGVEEGQGDGEQGQAKVGSRHRRWTHRWDKLGKATGKEWGTRKERRWTGTGGVAQGKARRDGTAQERPETPGRGTGTSANERRKSKRKHRRWGEGRTMGGQRGRERGGSGTVRKGTISPEKWGKG